MICYCFGPTLEPKQRGGSSWVAVAAGGIAARTAGSAWGDAGFGAAGLAGARGTKFAVFPGSALFKKPPRWVVSAELVETSRLWARVNARIEPRHGFWTVPAGFMENGESVQQAAAREAMEEALAHPHNRERNTFIEVDGIPQPAPAPRFRAAGLSQRRPRQALRRDSRRPVVYGA